MVISLANATKQIRKSLCLFLAFYRASLASLEPQHTIVTLSCLVKIDPMPLPKRVPVLRGFALVARGQAFCKCGGTREK